MASMLRNFKIFSSRTTIQNNLIAALQGKIVKPVFFGKLTKKKFREINKRLINSSIKPLKHKDLYLHTAVVNKLIQKRIIQDGMTAAQVADVAYSAIHNSKSRILSTKLPQIKIMIKPVDYKTANAAFIGEFGGQGSIKSVYPKELSKINKEALGGRGTPPSGANKLNPADPVSDIQGSK